jgi:uncharacterized protein (TIGR02453 family)
MAFTGFARNAMGFWHELAAEMNRDWFLANKERYEQLWVQPMTELLAGVATKLAPVYPKTKLAAPKIMRINRDVRFAKDKSPYKTWIGASLRLGDHKQPMDGVTALYLHFGIEEEFAGSGRYVFEDEVLAKWRKKVADTTTGPEIAKLVGALRKAGYSLHAYDSLQRVPKPYDAEHPRAELLKMKGLVVEFPETPKGLIHKPGFTDWLVKHAKAAAPMNRWLKRHLG